MDSEASWTVGRARRASPRYQTAIDSELTSSGFRSSGRITDLSTLGARVRCVPIPAPGSAVRMRLPVKGWVSARVMWTSLQEAGCRFDIPLSDEALASILSGADGTRR